MDKIVVQRISFEAYWVFGVAKILCTKSCTVKSFLNEIYEVREQKTELVLWRF